MRLRWLGCAGYEIVSERGVVLYVDPWLTSHAFNAPIAVGDIEKADAVLLTHAHFDHAEDVPQIMRRTDAVLFASREEIDGLNQIEKLPEEQLRPVKWDDTVEVKGCQIRVTKGEHVSQAQLGTVLSGHRAASPADEVARRFHEKVKEILPKGFFVTTESGLRVWHLGSCVPIPEVTTYSRALRPQVAIVQVPPKLEDSVGVENVKMLCKNGTGPSVVLPHHHDRIFEEMPEADVDLFVKHVKQAYPGLNVLNPKLGQYYEFELRYS